MVVNLQIRCLAHADPKHTSFKSLSTLSLFIMQNSVYELNPKNGTVNDEWH